MARTRLFSVLVSMMFATSAHASQIPDRPAFETAPVSAGILAGIHGRGTGFSNNFNLMVTDRSRVDDRAYANVTTVAMDAWWAEIGAQLIIANLR